MKDFQFDLILSSPRQTSSHDLIELEETLKNCGCEHPNPRHDHYGVRVSITVAAESLTCAIYLGTQYINLLQNIQFSVRSIEFH